MGLYEVGIEVSLPAKDKAWAESQKEDVIANAWALKKGLGDEARSAANRIVLGLLLAGTVAAGITIYAKKG